MNNDSSSLESLPNLATTPLASKPSSSFLEGLKSIFQGSKSSELNQAITTSSSQSIGADLSSSVEALKSAITKQRELIANQSSTSARSSLSSKTGGPSLEKPQEQEFEQSVRAMQNSIAALHVKLGTGMTEEQIDSFVDFFEQLGDQCQGKDVDSRIRASIAERLQRDLSPISWNIFTQMMESAKICWPEPGGIMPGATDEERSRAVACKMEEAQILFLSQSLKLGVENMRGIVSAWKRYPDSDNWLWQEVALRGVASGIRCALVKEAVDALRANAEQLKAKARELISEQMGKIQGVLSTGLHSLEEAEELVRSTDLVVTELLPDLASQQIAAQIPAWSKRFTH